MIKLSLAIFSALVPTTICSSPFRLQSVPVSSEEEYEYDAQRPHRRKRELIQNNLCSLNLGPNLEYFMGVSDAPDQNDICYDDINGSGDGDDDTIICDYSLDSKKNYEKLCKDDGGALTLINLMNGNVKYKNMPICTRSSCPMDIFVALFFPYVQYYELVNEPSNNNKDDSHCLDGEGFYFYDDLFTDEMDYNKICSTDEGGNGLGYLCDFDSVINEAKDDCNGNLIRTKTVRFCNEMGRGYETHVNYPLCIPTQCNERIVFGMMKVLHNYFGCEYEIESK